jgi:peptide-methionine (R)-S-oxide reductase
MTNEDFKKKLTPEQYRVMREHETEAPGSGKFLHEKGNGMYVCVACGNELFPSTTKFESGTGWPSFTDPATKDTLEYIQDTSYGMVRTEVRCKQCGSHLGHVFDDGPGTSGKRYCINSICLELKKEEEGK